LGLLPWRWTQLRHPLGYFLRHPDKRLDQWQLDIEVPFIFGHVSGAMCLVEHPRVRETLKYREAMLGPVAVPAQRCERKSVSGIVREVEPALDIERLVLGVFELYLARPGQAVELCLSAALP
jgi:hypothetical protein